MISYQDALDIIEGISKFGSRLELERIRRLSDRLDNIQDKIPIIHIGGTNGKGSVARMISSVLISAGYRVGLYTSPHLHSPRERIQVNSIPIDKNSFSQVLEEILPYIEDISKEDSEFYLTQFEILTMMAFLYFYKMKVDVIVLEVGLGGRLDATNIVNNVVATVITNVDWDHMDRLGSTIPLIAREKAGIIKRRTPVITGSTGDALNVIEDTAKALDAPIYVLNRDFSISWWVLSQTGTEIYFKNRRVEIPLFTTLKGIYQVENMAISVMTLELIKDTFPFSSEDMYVGLKNAFWPGRMEIVSDKPIVLLDGAHNKAGIEKLKTSLGILFCKKPTLIVGILKDKDAYTMLDLIAPYVKNDIIVTAPKSKRALEVGILAKIVLDVGKKPIIMPTIKEGISVGLEIEKEFLCITGSLYTIAEAREEFVKGIDKE
ncbi:MAG: bifunctional folylpolyglutamate synthase/dihydrofolate synthase [bacterium]